MNPFKSALIGALALSTAAVAMPGDAEAGRRDAERIANRLDRIEARVEDVRDIRRPRARLGEIDDLQRILHRLERRNDGERGRLARWNDRRIDHLQRRLARIERRTERRAQRRAERRDRRQDRYGYGHGGHGYGYGYGPGYYGSYGRGGVYWAWPQD